MAIESREPHEPRSLAEQIADAERRIVERRQWIAKRRVFLAQHIRQRATSPAALLLAGSLGFIVGELTRDNKNAFFEGEPVRAASPLLQVAGNAMEWVRPIFLAEFGKLMQTFSSVASLQIADHLARAFTKPNGDA
ncbi:MAG: hypothetical protein IPK63_19710 [Candidatus Competibacteraceae bacterium]|nr:hypothetical protein [Candidatus Competibacteraceae bacterium]